MALLKSIYFTFILTLSLGGNVLFSQTSEDRKQYQVKAAFLYRFVDYVEWKTTYKSQTFNIAILGKSNITPILSGIAKSKKAKNKKIEITEYDNLDKINATDVLFIPFDTKTPIETIISKFSGKAVLLVSEVNGFGKKGTHMNFVIVNNKLKFEVNQKAINRSNMNISSFLLQHAILVE